ncbi:MAG: hypothetical protein ACOC82_03050, partial [Candidatus Bipolaricaulota bacterium]
WVAAREMEPIVPVGVSPAIRASLCRQGFSARERMGRMDRTRQGGSCLGVEGLPVGQWFFQDVLLYC